MTVCYLGLGSNLGDKEDYLRKAVNLLAAHEGIQVCNISSIYATAPIGYTEQPEFLNIVLQVQTSLQPEDLLTVCRSVEQQLKRVRDVRWGPRTIDIDILLYENSQVHTPELTIPHPLMLQRLFVLLPLTEVAPDLRFQGIKINKYISKIQDQHVLVYKPW